MGLGRLAIIVAVVLFAVALILNLFTSGNADLVLSFTLGGFLAFALGHLLD